MRRYIRWDFKKPKLRRDRWFSKIKKIKDFVSLSIWEIKNIYENEDEDDLRNIYDAFKLRVESSN